MQLLRKHWNWGQKKLKHLELKMQVSQQQLLLWIHCFSRIIQDLAVMEACCGLSELLLEADLSGYAETWKLNWKAVPFLCFCLPKSFKTADFNHYFCSVVLFQMRGCWVVSVQRDEHSVLRQRNTGNGLSLSGSSVLEHRRRNNWDMSSYFYTLILFPDWCLNCKTSSFRCSWTQKLRNWNSRFF